MTTNLHDKMLAAIDALFSASDAVEEEAAENLLLDVRDEILKHKRAEQPAQSTADKSELKTVPAKGGLLPVPQAERLAKELTTAVRQSFEDEQVILVARWFVEDSAAELRRLVSFNQQLMDEVARLQKAVADEREACAKVCDARAAEHDGFSAEQNASEKLAEAIRARGNT